MKPTVWWLWCMLWMVGVVEAQPAAPDGWAQVEQEGLPALLAREAAAEARLAVRRRFRDGSATLDEAYPHLPPEVFGVEALMRGRLAALAEAEVQRSTEARTPPPAAQGYPQRLEVWRTSVAAAHEAESAADGAERSLLVGVSAQLRAHPELRAPAIDALRGDLEALRDHVASLPADVDPALRAQAEQSAAAAAGELSRLDRYVRQLRLAGAWGRRPDPASDLAALESPAARPAADRLALLQPQLEGAAAREVDAALDAYWNRAIGAAEVATASLTAAVQAVTEPEERLAELAVAEELAIARAAAAQRRVDELPGTDAAQRAQLAELGRWQAEVALAQARRRVRAGVADAQSAEATARLADEQAQAAAAAAGTDEQAQRVAEVKGQYAQATERAAELQRAVQEAEAQGDVALTSAIDRQSAVVGGLAERSRFGADRPSADALHGEVLATLDRARELASVALQAALDAKNQEVQTRRSVAEDRKAIEVARVWSATLEETALGEVSEILVAWEALLTSEQERAAQLALVTHAHEQAMLQDLQQARVTKRELAPHLSSSERLVDTNRFLEDLQKEADFLVPSVTLRVQERLLELGNPLLLLDSLEKVRALVAGFMWTVLAGLAWWWGRRRAEGWALSIATRVRQSRPELRMADVKALRDPMARTIRNVIDLLLGQVLLWSLGDALVEVQFLVRAYLYLAAYRALLAGFDLAVVPLAEVRPALLVLRDDTFALARRTVRWFLRYFVVAELLHWVLWDVLQLDTLAGAVDTTLSVLFWVIVVWSLFRWEPFFREALSRRRAQRRAWLGWLLPERGGLLLRIPRAVLQLGAIVFLLTIELLQRLAIEGTSLGWLFNALNRTSLREADGVKFRVIDDALRDRIQSGETPEKHRVPREEIGAVGTALSEWQHTGLRGLVAVVGDRGMGKHTACHEVAELLAAGGLEVRRARVPGPMRTESDLFAWLANAVGCASASTHDELVEAMRAVSPRAIVIESVHRTFARRVGGLHVVQALLYVLNAASDHHFFVVSVHGPTWDYFAARGSLIDCGVFHTVVTLAPFSSQQLRRLTLARAGAAGLRVDFSVLERQTALAGEPGTEEDRAITIFYRLLADASGGNPTAGVEIFTRCLEPTDDENVVRAHMAKALTVQPLTQLADDALFILVAVDLHDELDLDELVEVTNLPMAVVRATVRDLLSRGLLAREGTHLLIPDHQCRPVQRTLRRRHFLHLGGEA